MWRLWQLKPLQSLWAFFVIKSLHFCASNVENTIVSKRKNINWPFPHSVYCITVFKMAAAYKSRITLHSFGIYLKDHLIVFCGAYRWLLGVIEYHSDEWVYSLWVLVTLTSEWSYSDICDRVHDCWGQSFNKKVTRWGVTNTVWPTTLTLTFTEGHSSCNYTEALDEGRWRSWKDFVVHFVGIIVQEVFVETLTMRTIICTPLLSCRNSKFTSTDILFL